MGTGAEKSASGGGDAARADEAREWRGAQWAERVVLALIAVAVLVATWAMSPGLYTRTVEAEVVRGDLPPRDMMSPSGPGILEWGSRYHSLDARVPEQRSGSAWLDERVTGKIARIDVPTWACWVTAGGGAAVASTPVFVERLAGIEIARTPIVIVGLDIGDGALRSLGIRIDACAVMLLVMAVVLKAVKRVGQVGAGGPPVLRDEEGPSVTAEPPKAARWARVVGAAPIVVTVAWTLVSPTMMCPDSVDYVANAMRLMDTGSFAHFDGWRSPGYSVVLLGLLAFGKHVAVAAGLLNCAMVIATMRLSAKACGLIVREATGNATHAAWAAAAVMWVVGLDPWTMLWTRHVMPECASMLVVAVVVRVLVGMAVGQRSGSNAGPSGTAGPPKTWRLIANGAALGVFVGAACYLRGNFQLLVACVPVCIGVCVLARGGGFGRAVMVGGACAACGVGMLMPWIVRTHARTGEWSFTTGGQFARALFAQETGLMDWNQSEAFDIDHMVRLAKMRDSGTLGPYPFVHEMNTGKLAAMGDSSLPQLVNTDRRAKVMVDEALARRPAMRDVLALKAMSTQLGVWAFDVPGYRENTYWAGALRGGDASGPTGGDTQWADPASQTHLPKELVERVHARTTRSIEAYRTGAAARGFGVWWSVGSVARSAVAWAGVIGVGLLVLGLARGVVCDAGAGEVREADVAWVRGAVCVVLIAVLIAAHAAAIAWVVMTGLDRYAVAMIPASAVAAVASWCVARR